MGDGEGADDEVHHDDEVADADDKAAEVSIHV